MWRKLGIALLFLFTFLMGKAYEKRKVEIRYVNCKEESAVRLAAKGLLK